MNRNDYLINSPHIQSEFKKRLQGYPTTHIDDIGILVLTAKWLHIADREYIEAKNLRNQLRQYIANLQIHIASYENCSVDYEPADHANQLANLLNNHNRRNDIGTLPTDPTEAKDALNRKAEMLAGLAPTNRQ